MFFFAVSLEALATQERAQKQSQEREFLLHRENGLDTGTSEASTIGGRSNFYFFLRLLLLQHFFVKTEHEAEDQRVLLSCIFINHSCTCSGFIRGFTKMAEAEGSLKKGFRKQCVCSLFFFFVMVPFSLDTRSLCLFLPLITIPALIGVSLPHRTFFGVNFSRFFVSLCFPVANCFVQSGNQNRN